jgi:PucR family transcriptional regulator, purine catabolism regulatory protein
VGVAFQQVPRALLEEAERLDFPVFRIPYETPYRDIVGFVNRSLLSVDYSLLQRSLSMQNDLIDTLRSQQPVTALITRLGELLKSSVLLLDPDGALVAGRTDVPLDEIWAEICRRPTVMHRAVLHDQDVVNMPLGRQDTPAGWLVTISPAETLPRELVLSVVQSAERLLDVVSLGRRAVAAEERVARAELLASALDDLPGATMRDLAARLRRFGFGDCGSCRVITFAPEGVEHADEADRLRRVLEQLFHQESVPYLIVVRAPHVVAFVSSDGGRVGGWVGQLADRGHVVVAGVGRPVDDQVSIARSYQESQVALRRRAGSVRMFEDLGLATWMVSSVPRADFDKKLDELMSPFTGKPHLHETLSTYLASGLSIPMAARRLRLHANTLRYRLAKIEELLGRSLDDIPTVVDLYIGMLAADVPNHVTTEQPSPRPDAR